MKGSLAMRYGFTSKGKKIRSAPAVIHVAQDMIRERMIRREEGTCCKKNTDVSGGPKL